MSLTGVKGYSKLLEPFKCFFGIKNNTSKELHSKLRKEGIWAGTAAWDLSKESGVRISTHFYNKEEHIDKTISAIKKIINN